MLPQNNLLVKVASPLLEPVLDNCPNLAAVLSTEEKLVDSQVTNQEVQDLKVKALDLSACRFNAVSFIGGDFERMTVRNCEFQKCELIAADWRNGGMQRCVLSNCRISAWQLQDSSLTDVAFNDCKIDSLNLRYSKLKSVRFKDCTIAVLDLAHAELRSVSFDNCTIERLELGQTTLKQVDLRSSSLVSVSGVQWLRGATISHEQLLDLAPILANDMGLTVL